MRLLLRATDPRISRLLRRAGLRNQNYGQGRRAGTPAQRAVQPEVASADDSRTHGFRGAGLRSSGGESGGKFCGLRRLAFAVRGEVTIRTVAGTAFSGPERKSSQPYSRHSRRQAQRSELQEPNEGRRNFRSADGGTVSVGV